jgi:hypothetical protein
MSRIDCKTSAKIFKDNDYETTEDILKDLLPFIKNYNIIYDPFYCNGLVIKEWKKLNKICINEKLDAFNREHPKTYDIIISNIPFSLKKECLELFFKLNKPFIMLCPVDILVREYMNKYFDKLQFIVPKKRYNFYKENQKTKSCWFDTFFMCYGLNLKEKIIKL